MILRELIGKKIKKIRFNYNYDDGNGIQGFQSQLKLSNGNLVLIPNHPDMDYNLVEHYRENKSSTFEKAQRCGLASRLLFRNKTIMDIHFRYFEGAPYMDESAILELSNGKYITAHNSGPQRLTNINLIVMNKDQFNGLQSDGIELRSLKHDILKN